MKMMTGARARQDNYSTPDQTADVIFGAATDGTTRLRYIAGADAEAMLAARTSMPFEAYSEALMAQLGLPD